MALGAAADPESEKRGCGRTGLGGRQTNAFAMTQVINCLWRNVAAAVARDGLGGQARRLAGPF